MRHFIAPYKYIGGELTGRKVSFFRILLSRKARWASSSQYGVAIDFYDPDLMHKWVKNAAKDIAESNSTRTFPWPVTVTHREKSVGVLVDATGVATPTGDFFY